MTKIFEAGHRAGWQMCCHVTGDAGVDRVTLSARSFATKGRTVESSVEGLEAFAGEVLSKL